MQTNVCPQCGQYCRHARFCSSECRVIYKNEGK